MFSMQTTRTVARGMEIFLLVLLIGFECVPGLSGNDMAYLNQASLQLTRSLIIVNSAYALVYRPTGEQAQAMRDLQNVLPPFEHDQTLLLSNASTEAQDLLQEARSDYLSLLAAAHVLLAHPNTTRGSAELTILITHGQSYVLTMNQLLIILPHIFKDRNNQLFVIQFVLEELFALVFLLILTTFAWEKHGQIGVKSLPILRSKKELFVFPLLFLLVGLELLPLGVGNTATYFNQADMQRVRCEIFAGSAFALAYRPAAEKTLALSDLQTILPLFQQEQIILQTNTKVQDLVQQATPEYLTMVGAAQILSAYSGKVVDPVAVTTAVSHRQACFTAMDNITLYLQETIQQQTTQVFAGELAIEVVLIIFFAALLLFARDPFTFGPEIEKTRTE